jgi:hypothetical protein
MQHIAICSTKQHATQTNMQRNHHDDVCADPLSHYAFPQTHPALFHTTPRNATRHAIAMRRTHVIGGLLALPRVATSRALPRCEPAKCRVAVVFFLRGANYTKSLYLNLLRILTHGTQPAGLILMVLPFTDISGKWRYARCSSVLFMDGWMGGNGCKERKREPARTSTSTSTHYTIHLN